MEVKISLMSGSSDLVHRHARFDRETLISSFMTAKDTDSEVPTASARGRGYLAEHATLAHSMVKLKLHLIQALTMLYASPGLSASKEAMRLQTDKILVTTRCRNVSIHFGITPMRNE